MLAMLCHHHMMAKEETHWVFLMSERNRNEAEVIPS